MLATNTQNGSSWYNTVMKKWNIRLRKRNGTVEYLKFLDSHNCSLRPEDLCEEIYIFFTTITISWSFSDFDRKFFGLWAKFFLETNFFRHVCQNCILFVQKNSLEKNVFFIETKNKIFVFLSHFERKIFGLSPKIFRRHYQNCNLRVHWYLFGFLKNMNIFTANLQIPEKKSIYGENDFFFVK